MFVDDGSINSGLCLTREECCEMDQSSKKLHNISPLKELHLFISLFPSFEKCPESLGFEQCNDPDQKVSKQQSNKTILL